MKRLVAHLARSDAGASAAEFALVLPLLLLLLFGVIDAGRFMWDMNRAEKATQVGARVAIVTTPVSSDLINARYANTTVNGVTIKAGELIPAAALDNLVCTSSGCTCEPAGGQCPTQNGAVDSTTFNDVIVARMQAIMPDIDASNVKVTYSGSGFGFATATSGTSGTGGGGGSGSSGAMDISPLITVSLNDVEFHPITTLLFGTIDLPQAQTTLTAEDASGAYSN